MEFSIYFRTNKFTVHEAMDPYIQLGFITSSIWKQRKQKFSFSEKISDSDFALYSGLRIVKTINWKDIMTTQQKIIHEWRQNVMKNNKSATNNNTNEETSITSENKWQIQFQVAEMYSIAIRSARLKRPVELKRSLK